MSAHKHDIESTGSNPRDHAHPRQHYLRRAHRDWRLWAAVILMLAMVLVYVMSNSLSLRPGNRAVQSTPAMNAP